MYTIHPHQVGTMSDINKGELLTYFVDAGVTMATPVPIYLLLENDGDTVVLVDAGVDGSQYPDERVPEGGASAQHREALAEHGLTPDDVDYVVLTHLHNDHVGHVSLYTEAEILVQRAELEAARNPRPHMAFAYPDDIDVWLEGLDVTLLDGGYRLDDGLDILSTPGHTKGQQSVVVETDGATHALVSDLVYCEHNRDPSVSTIVDGYGEEVAVTPTDQEFIVPGLHVDTERCYENFDRIRERIGEDGVVLGGHEGGIFDRSYPA